MRYKNCWKQLKGFNTPYYINPFGTILNMKTGLQVAPHPDGCRYWCVNLEGHQYKLHRLVALYFVHNSDPKDQTCVNHLDENRMDDCAWNLDWDSVKDNNAYGHHNKRIAKTMRKHEGMPVILIQVNKLKWYPSLSSAARFIIRHKNTGSFDTVLTRLGRVASTDKLNQHAYGYGCIWCPYGKKKSLHLKGFIPDSIQKPKKHIIITYNGSDVRFRDITDVIKYFKDKLYVQASNKTIRHGVLAVLHGTRYSYKGAEIRYSNQTRHTHLNQIKHYHSQTFHKYKMYQVCVCGRNHCQVFDTLKEAARWIKRVAKVPAHINQMRTYLGKITSHATHNQSAYGFSIRKIPKDLAGSSKESLKKWVAHHIHSFNNIKTPTHAIILLKGTNSMKFNSLTQAAYWLIKNGYTHAKKVTVRNQLGLVCRGKRKHCYGFSAKYLKS